MTGSNMRLRVFCSFSLLAISMVSNVAVAGWLGSSNYAECAVKTNNLRGEALKSSLRLCVLEHCRKYTRVRDPISWEEISAKIDDLHREIDILREQSKLEADRKSQRCNEYTGYVPMECSRGYYDEPSSSDIEQYRKAVESKDLLDIVKDRYKLCELAGLTVMSDEQKKECLTYNFVPTDVTCPKE